MEMSSAILAICVRNSPVNSPHKIQWRRALMFSLICAWINGWVNNDKAGDLKCHHAHYDVTVMSRQDGCPVANGILKCISLNENFWVEWNKTLLKYVPYGIINNSTFRSDDDLVSFRQQAIIWTNVDIVHQHIIASPGLSDFNTEAETKWPTFHRWHFQMHFLE